MITVINAHLLTNEEKILIEHAIYFQFTKGICFDDLKDRLIIEIRPEQKTDIGNAIPVAEIERELEQAKKEERAAHGIYYRLQKECSDLKRDGRDEDADAMLPAVIAAENRWGNMMNAVRGLERLLSQSIGGFVYPERIINGVFISIPTPKVILYLGGYRRGYNRCNDVVSTFVHEMFHAVNYFHSSGNRTVREFEEPMVEFAAGVFLERFSRKEKGCLPVLDQHRRNLLNKASSIGEIACYGFGYYLLDNVNSRSLHPDEEWVETYSIKSASIDLACAEAKKVCQLLYPFYPKDKEQEVFDLFETLIFGSASRVRVSGSRKSPVKKTVIKVILPGGGVIQSHSAKETFADAILAAGPLRVQSLGILICGELLVSQNISQKYPDRQIEITPGVYVQTHSNNETKKRILGRISDQLGLGWKVETV